MLADPRNLARKPVFHVGGRDMTVSRAGLDAHVVVDRGRFNLDVYIAAQPDELVAVLGPNGAGKTTLLGALSGLIPLTGGRIELGGRVLDEPTSATFVPPAQRGVGVAFQDQLLFPHLSASDNVAFGLRARGMGRAEAKRKALKWLERVGLADLANVRPAQLSGGQAQRIALARALAADPTLLLLDEPLSFLDVGSRADMRRELSRHLATFNGVRLLVTHDPLDALVLADRLVVIESGRIVQEGASAAITARPRTPYVAQLVGTNLLRGHGEQNTVTLAGSQTLTTAGAVEGEVLLVVHPSAVALHRSRPEGSPRNTWEATVESIELLGERARVKLAGPVPVVAEVTPAAVAEMELGAGRRVWASVKATEITATPA